MGLYKRSLSVRDEMRKYNANKRRAQRLGLLDSSKLIRMETISDIEKYDIAHDAERLTAYNKEIEQWAVQTENLLKANVSMKSNRIAKGLHANLYTDPKYGFINKIGFSFPRHGVYLHFGAGTGQGGYTGSKWYQKKRINGVDVQTHVVRHTNPSSLGLMGTGSRTPFPWFDPIIRARIEALSDIAVKYFDTMVIDATKIYIEK